MAYQNPTVDDFKEFFARDFPFGTDPETSVLDSDIAKAMTYANVNINPALFASQSSYNIGYENLSAHYLVMNLRASSQGINGQYSFTEQSKAVGDVSAAYAIPQRLLDDPYWAMLAQTNYGAVYLQLLLPQLAGQMFITYGSTRP